MTLVVLIVLAGVCCGCMAQSYPELPAVTSECEVAFGKVCKDLSFPTCQRKKGAVTIAKRPHVARKQIGNESCKNKLIFVPIYSCTQTTGKPLYELMCNDGSKAFQIPAVVLSSNCRCKFFEQIEKFLDFVKCVFFLYILHVHLTITSIFVRMV